MMRHGANADIFWMLSIPLLLIFCRLVDRIGRR